MANKKKNSHQGKILIKKGDKVAIIAGNSKGTVGEVKQVLREDYRVIVEGVNMIKRHTKPSNTNPEGGIISKEAPIHLSNVMLVDKSGKPTRIKNERKDGQWVRVSKKSGEIIK